MFLNLILCIYELSEKWWGSDILDAEFIYAQSVYI